MEAPPSLLSDFAQALAGDDEPASYVPNDLVDFLAAAGEPRSWAPDWVGFACQGLGLSGPAAAALEAAWASVSADPELNEFFHAARDRLFRGGPPILRVPDGLGCEVPPLVLLSAYPALERFYLAQGLEASVRRATLGLLAQSLEECHGNTGHWALPEFSWVLAFFQARGFRLGRLQFIPRLGPRPVLVRRHRTEGQILLLSAPGVVYRSDGLVNGTNGRWDPSGTTARLAASEAVLSGLPLLASGICGPDPIDLDPRDWVPVFDPGDPWLDLHIPGDGPLDEASVRDSLAWARRFFGALCPNLLFTVAVCESWLLDPQLQAFLDPGANLLRFQQLAHLFPVLSDDRQSFENLFGSEPGDLSRLPETSRLQRRAAAHLRAGGALRMGGGVFLLP